MRALKLLVVIMGVLLIIGAAALVAAIIYRSEHRPVAQSVAGGSAPIELPAGAHILSAELSGDRVLVHVALADGSAQLLLFDARSGARVGTIALQPHAAP